MKIISFGDLYIGGALLDLYVIALSPPVQEKSIAFAGVASFIPLRRALAKETWSHLLCGEKGSDAKAAAAFELPECKIWETVARVTAESGSGVLFFLLMS